MKIDQLGLQIGCNLQLKMLDDEKIYNVQLIGFEAGEGLIITAPKSGGSELSMILRDDQPLDIFVQSFSYLVEFRSKIVEKRLTPYPHIHISVPENIEAILKNNYEIIMVNQDVTIINDDADSRSSQAKLTGISFTEARLSCAGSFAEQGQHITITMSFEFSGKNNVIVLEGRVSLIKTDTGTEADAITMTYEELDQSDKILLHAYIYEQMLINMNIVKK